jgi:tetratricopeptide (TPR) repeat protein
MFSTPRLPGARLAIIFLLFSGVRLLAAPAAATAAVDDTQDTQANALLQQGRVEEASAMLHQALTAQPDDARAHQLLCRVYYAQEMADDAIRECEQAAAKGPNDSDTQVWLGRAYGMKASHASPFTAIGIAKKVHVAFEHAIEIDPGNVAALDDLGEFYVAAPSMVGGGLDKAEALAAKIQARFPAQSHRLLGMIAEKKKDLTTAESEFKAAVAAGKTPAAYINLGHFYQRHNQTDKVLATLQSGVDADLRKDASLVDAASILTGAHLSPQLAESLLREYLSSSAKSDAAPAFKVHLQLGKLLAQGGDSAGAHREYEAAIALAPNYAPARKAMQGS